MGTEGKWTAPLLLFLIAVGLHALVEQRLELARMAGWQAGSSGQQQLPLETPLTATQNQATGRMPMRLTTPKLDPELVKTLQPSVPKVLVLGDVPEGVTLRLDDVPVGTPRLLPRHTLSTEGSGDASAAEATNESPHSEWTGRSR